MPELPEVETVCRGLHLAIAGRRILRFQQNRADLRAPIPRHLPARLQDKKVVRVYRRAKYILMEVTGGDILILHLGMSGRMVVSKGAIAPLKHDHLIFHLDKNMTVTFNDPRRFGLCDIAVKDDLHNHKLFQKMGVEPLSDDFTPQKLTDLWRGRKTSVKAALLDQRLVVGVGNIYAAEALFQAGIKPQRSAGSVKTDEIVKLVKAVRKILTAAIEAGGSSLRDYVQADGELGSFQNNFAVYGREGMPCKNCDCKGASAVTRITQNGRSTFYCKVKQQ